MEHILDICNNEFFHGFMESSEAHKLLKGQPEGIYLFRFSTTNPGSYAISVSYSGTVIFFYCLFYFFMII